MIFQNYEMTWAERRRYLKMIHSIWSKPTWNKPSSKKKKKLTK
jgi:hypothetical protein